MPTELHPVMWVWWQNGDPPRWLLAVQDRDPAYKHSHEWRLYDADGRYCSRQIVATLTEYYTHHTPIYAPRSTPT